MAGPHSFAQPALGGRGTRSHISLHRHTLAALVSILGRGMRSNLIPALGATTLDLLANVDIWTFSETLLDLKPIDRLEAVSMTYNHYLQNVNTT